jgi:SagB-type dehydrogenase family enzyme
MTMAEDPEQVRGIRIHQAISMNNLSPLDPFAAARGLRSNPWRHAAVRSGACSRSAEEFLVNSRLRRGDAEMGLSIKTYLTEPHVSLLSLIGQSGRRGNRAIPLPPSVELRMSLGEVIQKRRSLRRYTGGTISFPCLAAMLRVACGPGVAPSGGGLYPIEVYVAALRIEDLARAVYLYDPRKSQLWETGDGSVLEALLRAVALPGQVVTEDKASAICLLVGRPWRSMRKYGDRAMRYVFLEAGAIAEHISLAATALDLGSVHFASIYDDEAHEALRIDGVYEALIHAVVVGSVQKASASISQHCDTG